LLFERLRALRKRLADERDVPAYVIFSDLALVQMARVYPTTEAEFRRISGVGEQKLREFGGAFMAEIRDFLRDNPRRTFTGDAVAPTSKFGDSHRESLRMFRAGKSVEEIAAERGFVVGTILAHLGVAAEAGEAVDPGRFLSPGDQRELEQAFARLGWANLTGVREALDNRYPYEVLRIFRASGQLRARAEGTASGGARPGRTAESPPRSPGLAHAPA
jgi:ATP-dependent DNA helicase RecQ